MSQGLGMYGKFGHEHDEVFQDKYGGDIFERSACFGISPFFFFLWWSNTQISFSMFPQMGWMDG